MAIRIDSSVLIQINIDHINNKINLRNYILNQWITETINTKYRYFVETLSDGNHIYLERPGRLNKGCDFVIYLENQIIYKNGNDKPPPHNFILDDLTIKKNMLTKNEWDLLIQSIESIYNCESFQTAFTYCNHLPNIGVTYEILLKLLRWLFIEQDITYWSGKGRSMLFNVILVL